ncbi:uncharacterized membrane protein HdeD (DUF308 family) [Silvimonas terrae]|uniref:Uncharacterized membrane protein HdeD (DUF308 family) n=1 Tax=Silvimonas terrae TaxID=300266 RepID=A0A840RFA4_9NEIS|nr:hypothetical protein [Silvimonas terrae]MBB5192219.1 uncharacterized membrane protein HdeD (DUF308 family) [Silvimonas terrae]
MFSVLRILFVLAVLLIGFGAFKYQRTRDRFWLRMISWVLFGVLGLLLMFFAGLAFERLSVG